MISETKKPEAWVEAKRGIDAEAKKPEDRDDEMVGRREPQKSGRPQKNWCGPTAGKKSGPTAGKKSGPTARERADQQWARTDKVARLRQTDRKELPSGSVAAKIRRGTYRGSEDKDKDDGNELSETDETELKGFASPGNLRRTTTDEFFGN